MATKQEKARVVIRDFAGLMTNIDPADLPAGAAKQQVNVTGEKGGELRVRLGYTPVKFED